MNRMDEELSKQLEEEDNNAVRTLQAGPCYYLCVAAFSCIKQLNHLLLARFKPSKYQVFAALVEMDQMGFLDGGGVPKEALTAY